MTRFINYIQTVWKAVGAGVYAAGLFLYLQGTINTTLNPIEALTSGIAAVGGWPLGTWIALASAVAAAYGVTWVIPNKAA